eukprot:m.106357 g.106357  ORF g.106357 m.106357 type:complete len:145 (+) comp13299_c0_seq2:773-1207(+)
MGKMGRFVNLVTVQWQNPQLRICNLDTMTLLGSSCTSITFTIQQSERQSLNSPGVVCIEGSKQHVASWYHQIRSLPWQLMKSKDHEIIPCKSLEEMDAHRCFPNFCELVTTTHGHRGNHANMGEVRAYLTKHNLGHHFETLFNI